MSYFENIVKQERVKNMIRKYYFKSMTIIWLFKLIGFSYDINVTTTPPQLIEKAAFGIRICLFTKGIGIHRNYKSFVKKFNELNYENCFF